MLENCVVGTLRAAPPESWRFNAKIPIPTPCESPVKGCCNCVHSLSIWLIFSSKLLLKMRSETPLRGNFGTKRSAQNGQVKFWILFERVSGRVSCTPASGLMFSIVLGISISVWPLTMKRYHCKCELLKGSTSMFCRFGNLAQTQQTLPWKVTKKVWIVWTIILVATNRIWYPARMIDTSRFGIIR